MKKNLMKNGILLIAVIGAVIINGCVLNATRVSRQKSGQISSVGLKEAAADLSDFSGDISVTGTTDNKVKATVTLSEISSSSKDQSAIDRMSVGISTKDSIGTVTCSFADNIDRWELLRLEDITLTCDRNLAVNAKAVSGNIDVNGVNGFLTLETTSGNVNAGVTGGCNINVISGNIELSLAPDSTLTRVTAITTSGNVKVIVPVGFKADLDLETTSGDINAPGGNNTRLNGGNSQVIIKCATTSGNVSVEEQTIAMIRSIRK
jgi:DUF4097 and DUF4098 domain-containing protein YvlB